MCCNSWGRKELDTTERFHFHPFLGLWKPAVACLSPIFDLFYFFVCLFVCFLATAYILVHSFPMMFKNFQETRILPTD